ncbi:MAG: hypothetical protein Q9181_007408 [Wetmoreana brouardii]
MSTFISRQILPGAQWKYQIVEPLKGDGTHSSTIFEARVLPKAIIKTAAPDNDDARQCLKRELDVYRLPSIAKSPWFRKMHDVIGEPQNFDDGTSKPVPCLALEWMDHTLADLPCANAMRSYSIMKAVIETVMSSCVVLGDQQRVNTDTKAANILLSNVDTGHPITRIADLGLGMRALLDLVRTSADALSLYRDGSHCLAQPFALRAPEVHEGRRCVHRSQIWACAAVLLCWMKPGVLGPAGSPLVLCHEAWSVAKIRRLFPDWTPMPLEHSMRQLEFACSEEFIQNPKSDIQNTSSLEDELRTVKMLPEVSDLLRLLFVVSLEKRASAAEVLASKEYLALVEKAHTRL